MAHPKKARAGFPFIWIIVALALISIVAVITRIIPEGTNYDTQRKGQRLANLDTVLKEAKAKLGQYAWGDKEKGVVRIPIERAMELTAVDLKAAGVKPTEVKAESFGTNLIPPYLKPEAPAEGEAAPAPAEGEATPAPAEGTPAEGEATPAATPEQAAPAPEAPATEVPVTEKASVPDEIPDTGEIPATPEATGPPATQEPASPQEN